MDCGTVILSTLQGAALQVSAVPRALGSAGRALPQRVRGGLGASYHGQGGARLQVTEVSRKHAANHPLVLMAGMQLQGALLCLFPW